MKAVRGTEAQRLGAKNIALYAFIEIRAIFENRITTYITNAGRLVIPHNLPYALVVKIRTIRGEEINGPTQAQRLKTTYWPADGTRLSRTSSR